VPGGLRRILKGARPAKALGLTIPPSLLQRVDQVIVELLIRTILTRQWDDDTWPLVRQEFVKALALRSRLRKAGWWN
jgi:hypothetical protein